MQQMHSLPLSKQVVIEEEEDEELPQEMCILPEGESDGEG
jgi:hypothetical protein